LVPEIDLLMAVRKSRIEIKTRPAELSPRRMQLGYFHVMAEPVSNLRPGNLGIDAAAVRPRLVTKIVDAALAFGIAGGYQFLHRRVLDLGVIQRDEFDDGGMKLVFVALRRGAAFRDKLDVRALVRDDQRAARTGRCCAR